MDTLGKKTLLYPLTFAVALMFTACSDDDDAGDGTAEELEDFKMSFNVSGGDEGFKEGNAVIVTIDMSGNYTLNIRGTDVIGEEDEGEQTFSLDFNKGPQNSPIPTPEPGTYIIGTPDVAAAEDGFWVAYENSTVVPSESFGYADVEGELVVTDVTDNYIEGTFHFIAGQADGDLSIEVENGAFKARLVQ